IEEKSFQYGLACGFKNRSECPLYLAKICRKILKVLYGDTACEAIAVYENENKTLHVFPLKNLSQKYLDAVKRLAQKQARKRIFSVFFDKHYTVLGDEPSGKRLASCHESLSFNIMISNKLYGQLMIFSKAKKMVQKVEKYKFESVFSRASHIIIKVSDLIRSEKTKTDKIIEDMTEGIILFKEGEEISMINTAAKKILGLPRKGLIDNTKKEFVKMIFLSMLRDFQSSNETVEREIKLSYPHEKILKINITPTGESQKDALIVIRDVTHLKEVERLKDEIISTVSHELRTPLTAIDTMVSNMRIGITGKLFPKQKEYLERMKANIDRLSSLINNLLDISKLESGKITLSKDFYSFSDIFDSVHRLLEQSLVSKSISFKKQTLPSDLIAYIDRERIEQVLINLIYNSAKFTHAGGTILVRAQETERATLKLDVIDNGIGIEKDELSRIFQKFSQLGRTYGAGEKGTGLGLAICKKITEMHDGRITVKSPPDIKGWEKGSQFIVELPLKNEKEILKDIIAAAIDKASRNKTEFSCACISFPSNYSESRVRDIKQKIKQNIKNELDILFHFPKSHKIHIILHCTGKDVKKILKRLRRVIGEARKWMHLSMYPKDFVDSEEYSETAND
ncbi:MAG: hypothetical protein JW928_09585, partial [Candidatus Aureabacteria bacterium]|nr:hypothetical protein [Candidatus Auribacterota bacterium]